MNFFQIKYQSKSLKKIHKCVINESQKSVNLNKLYFEKQKVKTTKNKKMVP